MNTDNVRAVEAVIREKNGDPYTATICLLVQLVQIATRIEKMGPTGAQVAEVIDICSREFMGFARPIWIAEGKDVAGDMRALLDAFEQDCDV